MKTYVILFRGINVGGKNLLPMKELKTLLEREAYSDVQTYIQSGNLVLKAASDPAEHIASLVLSQFGFSPKILAIEAQKFVERVDLNPYQSFEGKTVHLYFCANAPQLNMAKMETYLAESEVYTVIDNVFYLHAPDGIGRSKLIANIEACLGVTATGRNLNTASKLYKMVKDV